MAFIGGAVAALVEGGLEAGATAAAGAEAGAASAATAGAEAAGTSALTAGAEAAETSAVGSEAGTSTAAASEGAATVGSMTTTELSAAESSTSGSPEWKPNPDGPRSFGSQTYGEYGLLGLDRATSSAPKREASGHLKYFTTMSLATLAGGLGGQAITASINKSAALKTQRNQQTFLKQAAGRSGLTVAQLLGGPIMPHSQWVGANSYQTGYMTTSKENTSYSALMSGSSRFQS